MLFYTLLFGVGLLFLGVFSDCKQRAIDHVDLGNPFCLIGIYVVFCRLSPAAMVKDALQDVTDRRILLMNGKLRMLWMIAVANHEG